MRVLLKATLDTEKGNEAIRTGKMPELMKGILDQLKPEAAYFGPLSGRRTALLVLDLKDSSDVPSTGEPFFTQFEAEVEMTPIMNGEDLQNGLAKLR
jgi:hypothetical protein